MSNDALKIEDIHFAYNERDVIRGINLSVDKGEFVGIIGPNGSGKSTLIKLLTGYIKPSSGDVSIWGKSLKKIRRRKAAQLVAVVPQEMNFHFPYKVEEFVQMGRHPYQGLTESETESDRHIVEQAMEATDTVHLADRSVMELSGGEKQRVVLASVLAQDTNILFLDEPTSSMDIHYQVEIYEILKRLNAEKGLTIVAVTHDLNLGSLYCQRLILIDQGKIAADGKPVDIINSETISEHFNVDVESGISKGSNTPFIVPIGRKLS